MAEKNRRPDDSRKASSSASVASSSGADSIENPISSSLDEGKNNTFGSDDQQQQKWKWSKTRQIGLWMKSSVREATHTSKKTVEFVRDVTRTGKQAVTGVVTGESPFVNFDDADGDLISQSIKKVKRRNFSGYVSPEVRNIDEAMFSLHTLLSEQGRSPFDATTSAKSMQPDEEGSTEDGDPMDENYDWILDGDFVEKLDNIPTEHLSKQDSSQDDNNNNNNNNNNNDNKQDHSEKNDGQIQDIVPTIISIPHDMAKEALSAVEKLSTIDQELISLLPTDVSTMEGRFIQRILEESTASGKRTIATTKSISTEVIKTDADDDSTTNTLFTDNYYETEYDPIMDLILAIPLNIVQPSHDEKHQSSYYQLDLLDPFVTDTTTRLDNKTNHISEILHEKINANVNLFYELSSVISLIEHDVSQALLSSKEGSKLLKRSRGKELDESGGSGILAWDQIAQQSYERDNIRLLYEILESVSSVVDLENEITSFFDAMSTDSSNFLSTMPQLPKLIEVSMNFRDRAFHSIELMEVQCLNDLRTRASSIMQFLCQRLETCLINFLSGQCKRDFKNHFHREWKSETLMEYVNILSARLALEPFVKQESVSLDEPSVHISWTSSIARALTFELHRNVAKSLLKPTVNAAGAKNLTDNTSDNLALSQLQDSVDKYAVNDGDLILLQNDVQFLINLRFETEVKKCHLPWVYHQLCGHTAEILHLFHILSKGHESSDDMIFESVKTNPDYRSFLFLGELTKIRTELWKNCETVLIKFLDMYLASFLKLQSKPQSDGEPLFDDQIWSVTVEGLEDILQMTNHIITLAREYNGTTSEASVSPLREKVQAIIFHHLRSFEADAMSSIGYMMAQDTWLLCQMPLSTESFPSQDKFLQGFSKEIQCCYPDFSSDPRVLDSQNARLSENKFTDERRGSKPFFSLFTTDGNPFVTKRRKDDKTARKDVWRVEWRSTLLESYCQQLLSLYGYQSLDFMWGTKTSINLAKWAARCLFFFRKLPIVADDVLKTTCNIFDLFLVTVFRISACDEANANVMLGAAARSGFIMDENHALLVDNVLKDASGVSKGATTAARPKESNLKNPVSPESTVKFIEADIVAAQRSETDKRSKFQAFVRRGQDSRYRTSTLRKYELSLTKKFNFIPNEKQPMIDEMKALSGLLHDRLIACYSSYVVASFAHVTLALMNDYLKTLDASLLSYGPRKDNTATTDAFKRNDGMIGSARDLADSYLDMVPLLCDLCSRMAGIRVIKVKEIVTAIVKIGPDWSKKAKLHEQSNDYVDILVERSSLIWGFMSSWYQKSYPENIIGKSWSIVVESGFVALLEGFAQISSCSTEGRALMSIDLATYSSGVNRRNVKEKLESYEESFAGDIPMPPSPTVMRGMQYVDTYIKVFYFPLEDVIKWIEKNRGDYYLSQLLSLVSCCVLDRVKEKDRQKVLAEMIQKVKAL